MKKLLLFMCLITTTVFAQVGIGTTTPDASAKLDITATDKGILVPRVALIATNNALPITTPAESLLIYNTATASSGATIVTPGFYYWNVTEWKRLETKGNSWEILGNAGTNAVTNFIGTTDAQNLIFKTNNTEKMRVFTNGNVSIGTTSSTSRLTVNTPSTSTFGIGLLNTNDGDANNLKIGFSNNVTSRGTGEHVGIRNYVNLNSASNASSTGVDTRVVVSGSGSHIASKNVLRMDGTSATSNYASLNNISVSNFTNVSTLYGEHTNVGYSRGVSYGEYKLMNSNVAYPSTMYGDFNSMVGNGNGVMYGNYNDIKVSGTGAKYGLYNNFSNVRGSKIGVYNFFSNGNGSESIYGVQNRIYNDGAGIKYGTYNYISSNLGRLNGSYNYIISSAANTNVLYGVYSFVSSQGTGRHYGGYFSAYGTNNYGIYSANTSASGWAGYFVGRGYFGGDLGVGINNPTEKLQVESDRILLRNSSNTMYCSKNTSNGYGFELIGSYPSFGAAAARAIILGGYNQNNLNGQGFDSANKVQCGGGVTATMPIYATAHVTTSSAKYKKNVSNLKYGLDEILKIRPVTYQYTFDKTSLYKVGFIAEEVSEIIPEVVAHIDSDGNEVTRDKGNAVGMDYSQMTAVLVNAIKEQQAQIEELRKEIKLLKQ